MAVTEGPTATLTTPEAGRKRSYHHNYVRIKGTCFELHVGKRGGGTFACTKELPAIPIAADAA